MIAWKRILGALVESCAYMDPIAYTYYAAAKRQAAERAWTEKDEPDEEQPLHLIEKLQAQSELLAKVVLYSRGAER